MLEPRQTLLLRRAFARYSYVSEEISWGDYAMRHAFVSALSLLLVALAFTACSRGTAEIDFSELEQPESPAPPAAPSVNVLRVAIASVISPVPTSSLYGDFAAYLGERMGRPAQIVQGQTYAEINDLVRTGDVTLALVCTNPYLQGQEDFGMELLVVPEINGKTDYYSYLITRTDVTAQSLADLRGASFAFTDPLSNSGRLAPLYQLALAGETPDQFFSRTIFTYAHDSSVRAVAAGVVTAAAVDSLALEYMQESEPEVTNKLRIVQEWGPYGINPIVVGPRLDSGLKAELKDVLLNMSSDPRGREILDEMGVDRFVVPDDRIYDSVREMRSYLRERGLGP